MLRSTLFDLRPLALGASLVLHAAVLVAATVHPSPSNGAIDEVVGVDVVADPSPPFCPTPQPRSRRPSSAP